MKDIDVYSYVDYGIFVITMGVVILAILPIF
jgi:hypothetical protein